MVQTSGQDRGDLRHNGKVMSLSWPRNTLEFHLQTWCKWLGIECLGLSAEAAKADTLLKNPPLNCEPSLNLYVFNTILTLSTILIFSYHHFCAVMVKNIMVGCI